MKLAFGPNPTKDEGMNGVAVGTVPPPLAATATADGHCQDFDH